MLDDSELHLTARIPCQSSRSGLLLFDNARNKLLEASFIGLASMVNVYHHDQGEWKTGQLLEVHLPGYRDMEINCWTKFGSERIALMDCRTESLCVLEFVYC